MIIWYFKIKNTKRWYKITALNWFNDFVFIRNKNELNKLYKISNEYNISKNKESIIYYMDHWYL